MSERQREPAPMMARRLPSGRGAMEQPNNTSDTARLTVRFWLMLLATAVATGLLGALMMAVLHATQHLAFGYSSGPFGEAVANASDRRRFVALLIGGAVVGPAWYLLRRVIAGSTDVDDSVWTGTGELGVRRSLGTGVISEVAIGAGASLGREAAPKLLGAASGSLLAGWAQLDPGQRRLLVACGAGAGMGAVYNVPLGGALPALLCSVLATVVSWVYLPTTVTYPGLPTLSLHAPQVLYAALAGPLIGLFAVVLVRAIGWVSHHQLRGRWVLIGPLLAFSALGVLGPRVGIAFGGGGAG